MKIEIVKTVCEKINVIKNCIVLIQEIYKLNGVVPEVDDYNNLTFYACAKSPPSKLISYLNYI